MPKREGVWLVEIRHQIGIGNRAHWTEWAPVSMGVVPPNRPGVEYRRTRYIPAPVAMKRARKAK